MSFEDALNQTIEMLRRHKRVSYRALRRQFEVDETYVDDLKSEIIDVLKLAVDEGGLVLVWTGSSGADHAEAAPARHDTSSTPDQTFNGVQEPHGIAARNRDPIEPGQAQGERRHLTLMFCDLVDSTPLAERLDPEELAEVYGVWQDACGEAVAEHGGHIADYRGDGIFVYFGYPSAFEDGPHRAIRAGLSMLHHLQRVNEQLRRSHATTLAVRIGIHAGLVLLSDFGGRFSREHFALGETPNITARLQALAGENQVIVSGAVRNLVRGFFDFDDLGEQSLKGVSRPVSASRVLGATGARDRLQANEKAPSTFVAREPEIAALRLRWAVTLQGHGHAIMLSGEAGIGKSRLVRVAIELAHADGAQRVVMRCSPYHSASALHPVIEHMLAFLEIERRGTPETNFSKLKEALERSGAPDPARHAELIGGLLAFPLAETSLTQNLSAPQRRTQALEALVQWSLRSAAARPLLFVIEDIHWADPSTLEFLGLLLESIGAHRLCVVITGRPDYRLPFHFAASLTQINVGRLTDDEALCLVESASRGRDIPLEVRRQIVARADGVPLFIEELVAMMFESGLMNSGRYSPSQPITSLPIPLTLQDSLAARLDRLADARETAQLAAALGREFPFKLISAVSSTETSTLLAHLGRLVDSELVQQQGIAPNAVYRFKHALIQDAAYHSMLKSRRQQYHRRIASALQDHFAETVEAQPEILAHHFSEALLLDEASRAWRVAGEKALRRSANLEALHHLDRGLAMLTQADATPERAKEELLLQMARGTALLMVKGQSAPEVEASFARAQVLSKDMEDTPELFTVLFGLWRSHMARGSLQAARDIAVQLQAIAERLDDPVLLLGARSALSLVLYHLCELQAALTHAKAGIAIYDSMPAPAQASPIFNMGQHPALACYLCMSFILVLTGAADQALVCQRRGVEIARRTGIPFQVATAAGWSVMLACLRRDSESALDSADKVLALAREHVFPHWEFIGHFHRGILLVERGEHKEGLALAHAGIGAVDKLGFGNIRVRFHALIAEACRIAGQAEEGLAALRQASASFDRSGEQWWQPELHRIQGELILGSARPDIVAGEQCLREALQAARSKGLRLFELRAATSLGKVLDAQGRRSEARAALEPVLAAFTEGFGTRDLIEARQLLDTLAG